MIELKLKHTALRWDFSFFAVLALFFWLDSSGFGLTTLGVCAAHELAHLAVMKICGISPEFITFYGAGIRITSRQTNLSSPQVQAAVYSAGCLMNFLLAAALYALDARGAAVVSLFTGLFNLLPVGEFDGRALLRILLIRSAPPEKVDGILTFCGAVSVAVCGVAVAVVGGGGGVTLALTLSYLLYLAIKGVQ